MKKYILCGALAAEGNNFGDELLLKILRNNLKEVDSDIILKYTKKGVKNHAKLRDYKEADAFIYIPGGYMGYIEKFYSGTLKKTIQRVLYYYWPGVIATLFHKKIIILAAGIGPYEYKCLSPILRFIANRAGLITVRDQESYDFMKSIGVRKKMTVTADSAQSFMRHNLIRSSEEGREIRDRFQGKRKVFVLFTGYTPWTEKVLEALEKSLFKKDDIAYIIGADASCPHELVDDFSKKFVNQDTFTFYYSDYYQLLSIFNEVDTIITCKLHTGIVGSTMGKAVVCIAVQYDKSICYYKKIGEPDRIIDFFSSTTDEMAQKILEYYESDVKLKDEILDKAEKNYDILKRYLK